MVEILKLVLAKILNFKFSRDADVWLEFVVDVDAEDNVGNSLLIWELQFGQHFAADVL